MRQISHRRVRIFTALLFAVACAPPLPASALSEIKRENLPPPGATRTGEENPFPGSAVPLPGPIRPSGTHAAPDAGDALPDAGDFDGEDGLDVQGEAALPEVLYDLGLLPEPTRRMHRLILEACRSGDIERLRPLIGPGDSGTQLSFGGGVDDPIAFLKELSGDEEGHEILAILLEVLSAGYVHLELGTSSELYVWPYFFAVPLDRLTGPQRVELFTLVTAGDYEEMKTYGAYIFYRAGITPDGRWAFFVAGD
jgi:hypothetical protein